MRKYIALAMVFSILILPMVSATTYWMNAVDELNLAEKDSSWNIIEGGASGIIKFTTITRFGRLIQQRAQVKVYGLEPKTKYQLIYYGNEENNDVWPYATCIGKPRMTSTRGYFSSGSSQVNHLQMRDDGVAQKFWVVSASDVDCGQEKMIAWNPSEYLFETNTI